MSDDPYDVLAQYTTAPEWVRETDRDRLIPTGTYEGQITGYTVKAGSRDPFVGVHLVRCQAELYNVDGQPTRMHFFDVCPTPVTRPDGKQTGESRLWIQLAKATGTVGKTAPETVQTALLLRLRFRVRLSEAAGDYEARNWTDAISTPR